MEDVVAAGASAAPTPEPASSSPAPSEPTATPEKPSRFAALMAEGDEDADAGEDPAEEASTDGTGTDDAEGAEPPAEAAEKGEQPAQEETAPEDEEDVPRDLKKILKANPELRAAYYYKRDLDPLGISVDEAQAYREHFQSLDDLRFVIDRVKGLDAFEALLFHPDEKAPEQFLEGLRMVSAEGADRVVKHLAKNLPRIAPEAYYEIGGQVWESGLSRLEALAGDDPFRREAIQAVRDMIEEASSSRSAGPAAPKPAPLPNPDAEELAKHRESQAKAQSEFWTRLNTEANQAADREVRALVDEVVKRRDPNGVYADPDVIEQIVHEVHRTIASGPGADVFKRALYDGSLPPEQRIAKAAREIKLRAKTLVDTAFARKTTPIKERVLKASQLRLGKAAKVVTLREATGGRTATTPTPAPPKGARLTSRDIFRASMRS